MYHPIGLAKTLFPDSAAFRLLTCVTMSAGRRAAPPAPALSLFHSKPILARDSSPVHRPCARAAAAVLPPQLFDRGHHRRTVLRKRQKGVAGRHQLLTSWGPGEGHGTAQVAAKPATPIAHVGLAETEWPGEEGDGRRGGFGGDRGSRGRGRPTVWGLWREGGWGSLPVSRGQTKGPCGCRRRRRPRKRAGGLRVVSVARGPHTLRLSSSQAGGPRVSGEVGGVHRAERTEVSGVSGGLSRLPEAMWRCGLLGVAVGLRARRRPLSMIVSMSFCESPRARPRA